MLIVFVYGYSCIETGQKILLPCEFILVVCQEKSGGKGFERIGLVIINLSEYADKRSATRKYLLQDSKINSILRVI